MRMGSAVCPDHTTCAACAASGAITDALCRESVSQRRQLWGSSRSRSGNPPGTEANSAPQHRMTSACAACATADAAACLLCCTATCLLCCTAIRHRRTHPEAVEGAGTVGVPVVHAVRQLAVDGHIVLQQVLHDHQAACARMVHAAVILAS